MTDVERYRLFEELKEVGGEKTIVALTPLLDVIWTHDPNVSDAVRTLQVLGKRNPQLILDIVYQGTDDQGSNAVKVLRDMGIDEFERIRMLIGLYVEGKKEEEFS